jgi:F-type H+-transporting ATPase subunit a
MNLPEISIAGEKVFEVFGISFTNTFILSLVISISVFIFAFLSLRSKKMLPKKLQNFWEFLLESLYNFFNSVVGNAEKTKEIFPLACTIFILILSCNLIELIPGVGIFHFLRSPSSDLNFTFAIASFSMVYINVIAFKKLGFVSFSKRFIHKNPFLLFAGLLEASGELTRTISLAFRLFGNLFAGEVLLTVTSFLFAYLLPLPFLGLEILVGFIQAFIFSSLIVIFYITATAQHGQAHTR